MSIQQQFQRQTPMERLKTRIWEKFTRLIYKQTILVLILLLCLGISLSLWQMFRLSENLIQAQALQNAHLSAKVINQARGFYSLNVVNRVRTVEGVTVTDDYHNRSGAIPNPATYTIEMGEKLEEQDQNTFFRLYSDYPFPNREATGGVKDDFEAKALEYLRQDPAGEFWQQEKRNGYGSFRYAEAIIMETSCVSCHNSNPQSPKTDWKVGDVRGVLEIVQPLEKLKAETRKGLRGVSLLMGLMSVLGLTGITLVIGRLRNTSKELESRVIERTAQLQEEQEKSERLLLNILPEAIANELKEGKSNLAQKFDAVTILFADIVSFTQLSAIMSPTELVDLLNEIFSAFDRLTEEYGLEKIKTIGDAYMVAGGIPYARPDHAEAIAAMALDMQQEIIRFNKRHNRELSIRIGINSGAVVAGVIGKKKFIYDLWGDAVNTASRMESHGISGYIQVTETTYQLLQAQYVFQERSKIKVKSKGEIKTYLLLGEGRMAVRPSKTLQDANEYN